MLMINMMIVNVMIVNVMCSSYLSTNKFYTQKCVNSWKKLPSEKQHRLPICVKIELNTHSVQKIKTLFVKLDTLCKIPLCVSDHTWIFFYISVLSIQYNEFT